MISHFFTAPSCSVIFTFWGRVIRIPLAAEPRFVSLLPWEGEASCIVPSSRAQVGAFTAH